MRFQSSRRTGEVNFTLEERNFRARESGLVDSGLGIFARKSSATIADPLPREVSNAPMDASPFLRTLQLMTVHFRCRFALYSGRLESARDQRLRGNRRARLSCRFSAMVAAG